MRFAQFINEKRRAKGFTLRGFADMVGIAPSYMSDIEKEKRNAPTEDILDAISKVLELSNDEYITMLDLAANSKNEIAKDITSYVKENSNVRVALRRAKELNYGEEEWIRIIEELERNND